MKYNSCDILLKKCGLAFSLILVVNVVNVSSQNIGVPLPPHEVGEEGQNSSMFLTLDESELINATVHRKSSLNFDPQSPGKSIIRPLHGPRVPGSLHHIREPSHDGSVLSLLRHPSVLNSIQTGTSADSTVKIDSVISAHKQLVSGRITYLSLKVVKTNCLLGSLQQGDSCNVDRSAKPFICEVAVWERPWLNSTKVIEEQTRCTEVEGHNEFWNWNIGKDGLRRFGNEVHLESLPTSLDEHQVVLEAFDYIDRGSKSKFKGQMIDYGIEAVKYDPEQNITAVDVSIEYGFTLCLKFENRQLGKLDERFCPPDVDRDYYVCKVTVISDPNLTINLKVLPDASSPNINCYRKESVNEELVVPVKIACAGCPQPVSLNDPSILRMAEFAIMEYDRSSESDKLHSLVKLHSAQTQVVNGIKYFLNMELAETNCNKALSAINMNRTLCSIKPTEDPKICDVVVKEQPWQKSQELVTAACYKRSERALHDEFIIPVMSQGLQTGRLTADRTDIGHETPSLLDQLSPEMQSFVQFALDAVNHRALDDFDDGLYKIVNVLKAATFKEKLGMAALVVVELAETICREKDKLDSCPVKEHNDHEICSAKVLNDSSTANLHLLSLKCTDNDQQSINENLNPLVSHYIKTEQPFFAPSPSSFGLPGGPLEQPTNTSVAADIASYVVEQYNLHDDDDELYKLGRIISSYSQVTSIVKYIVELELLETYCKKYQPITDEMKCQIDGSEEPEICQADVSVDFSPDEPSAVKIIQLNRLFCDDREDYYVKKMSQSEGVLPKQEWKLKDTNSPKVKALGKLVADEFDQRSDEENVFILFKVLEFKMQDPGLSYYLKVELAETICPKYKGKINKTRCIVDIGEEHKICYALVKNRPWANDKEVTSLKCIERDDSAENDDSKEVFYPRVHPSAHARPKFISSKYRILEQSGESDESNEKYYLADEVTQRQAFFEKDSDEGVRKTAALSRNSGVERRFLSRDDDDDGDKRFENDSKSRERFGRPVRLRRQSSGPPGAPNDIAVNDPKVRKIANYAVSEMDKLNSDPALRRVKEICKASKQIVAGVLWKITVKVSYTTCLKATIPSVSDLSKCQLDTRRPQTICTVSVWEKTWQNFRKLMEATCRKSQNRCVM